MTSGTDQRNGAPTKWGKVIDNRKCIGCHACTVACKQEHEVPLGVNRTYVKQVEVGTFPNVRRHFQVTRCNQCDDPPCVEICPTTAMFQRPDGIVDFDRSRCIGCKACIAACPYDAIYIDPVSHSAEKCNFCTNRVDRGLQPACVVVCPTQAIFVGDLNDSGSRVSLLVATEDTRVRKPEKKTEPKLFYVEASEYTLTPGAATNPTTFLDSPSRERMSPPGSGPRPAWAGPIDVPAGPIGPSRTKSPREANSPANTSAAALLSYDNAHEVPWNWIVSAYTWTKSVAAGIFLISAILGIIGVSLGTGFEVAATLAAASLLALTGGLLVLDLDHPERFIFTIIKPQWRSWLVRGAYAITAYGVLLAVYVLALYLDLQGPIQLLRWFGVLLAAAAAVYTAFLFGQAKARDLWQDPSLPLHLLAQAGVAGSAALVLISQGFEAPPEVAEALRWALLSTLGLHVLMTIAQLVMPHASADGARAAANMTSGRYGPFYWGALVAGGVAPLLLALLAPSSSPAVMAGAVLALAGLSAYEHAFVQAGQSVPLS